MVRYKEETKGWGPRRAPPSCAAYPALPGPLLFRTVIQLHVSSQRSRRVRDMPFTRHQPTVSASSCEFRTLVRCIDAWTTLDASAHDQSSNMSKMFSLPFIVSIIKIAPLLSLRIVRIICLVKHSYTVQSWCNS